jgi:hypothetical protein
MVGTCCANIFFNLSALQKKTTFSFIYVLEIVSIEYIYTHVPKICIIYNAFQLPESLDQGENLSL